MGNFPVKVGNKNGIDTYVATLTNGEEQLLITRDGKQYLSKGDGTKIEVSDVIVVDTLPENNIQPNKIYILGDFSLNYYDGRWHVLGSNQIVIGHTNADTSKLWLDTTSTPILKYHNGTSWINISGTVDTSILLDKTTYKGSADGIVKKADTLTGLVSTPSQIDNTVANSISPNIANRSNGKVVTYNASTGEEEWADVNITGVIGSTQITTIENTTIESGMEKVFNHPTSVNIVPVIEEQVASSNVTDTHLDFSDSSKYILQDSGKILVGSNKAELDIYTKLLMHMDEPTFKDECGHTITNNGVTLDTINKKFGNSSAYFNGSSSLSTISSDFDFGVNNFTIDFWVKSSQSSTNTNQFIGQYSSITNNTWFICNGADNIFGLTFLYYSNGWNILRTNQNVCNGNWNHCAIVRDSSYIYAFINGILIKKMSFLSSLSVGIPTMPMSIGKNINDSVYFNGNLQQIRILKGVAKWTNNFTPVYSNYAIPYTIINTPTYLKTTGSSDYSLTTIDTITSLNIPVTLPSVNTTCKILTSFDNGVNWLYRSGGVWNKYTGDLTTSWTSSNLNTDLQTYFENLSMTTLTSDLSSLGIVPIAFDMAFQLSTSSLSETPVVSAITMVYVDKSHNEFASYGSYSSSNVEFGVKRVSNSQLAIKNLATSSKVIKVNLVTSV